MKDLKEIVLEFMSKNPNQEQMENFYINKILPKTKNSITEILDQK